MKTDCHGCPPSWVVANIAKRYLANEALRLTNIPRTCSGPKEVPAIIIATSASASVTAISLYQANQFVTQVFDHTGVKLKSPPTFGHFWGGSKFARFTSDGEIGPEKRLGQDRLCNSNCFAVDWSGARKTHEALDDLALMLAEHTWTLCQALVLRAIQGTFGKTLLPCIRTISDDISGSVMDACDFDILHQRAVELLQCEIHTPARFDSKNL
ncbi:hypothetical protein AJ80_08581 [Polytolypa hystricis UAMH7299]|uniref:Uncharacterized protein n=1 Tax=Polytolypa hystricis (strain UAMH7299) TaxID=1447883 RepID=A0A2B7X5F1_POLH7|nr:hypothetical protein AJ80_08581 [Polytolypa hystricis UAMH7299]